MAFGRVAAAVVLVIAAGCGGGESGGGADAGADARVGCAEDRQCDDGLFCNGAERCVPSAASADAFGCAPGEPPCMASQSCNEREARCVSDCAVATDADGDGHDATECGGDDCDDADANRFPGNTEVCDPDHHDEDCDPSTYGFRDADADGAPDARCCNESVDGLVCGNDCDDMQSTVHPAEAESCDGLDNDCDGETDEGATRRFFPDADFDGFGDATATPIEQCAPPSDGTYVENSGDCDDGEWGISPAADDVCNGIDDDCDGEVDEAPDADLSCDAPNGVFECVGGHCALVACAAPYADCDGTLGTGCETDTRSAAAHCGGCGNDCGAGGVCTAGSCDVVVAIGAGHSHTCAVRESGALACWGDNAYGQLGDGTRTRRTLPVAVTGLSDVTWVAPAWRHTCARPSDGSIYCWGLNDQAQLGDGGSTDRAVPAPVSSLGDTIDAGTLLFAGAMAESAATGGNPEVGGLDTGVRYRAWGENDDGELGLGTTDPGLRPRKMEHLFGRAAFDFYFHTVWEIAFGFDHTCVAGRYQRSAFDGGGAADGVVCWGRNDQGQLGNVTLDPSLFPQISQLPAGAPAGPYRVGAGSGFTCAAAGGSVFCWGDNRSGQLGIGSTSSRSAAPVAVSDVTDAVAVAVGGSHACALRSTGGVWCWGAGSAGQLGDGSTTLRRAPVAVAGLSDATQVVAGVQHTCALRATGTVVCWGSNHSGQLGSGMPSGSSTPTAVLGL